MYSFTLGFSKPQRMVQIWEGQECNGSCPTRKSTHRLKGSGMLPRGSDTKDMLEVMSSAGHIICLLKPPWCWSCSPTAHPPVRVSPRMAPLLLLSEELDRAGSLSLVCGLRSVWSQKPLGFRPWSPWVSSGRCSLSLTFEASECIYSHLPERHWSKFSRLLHLLSSKSSSPHWKDPLLLLYWRSRENKCFQIIHNLCDFNKSKNKHLEHDRRITVAIYHYLREDKPNALEALWTFRPLRKSATQSKMFENVFFLNHAFPKWIWTHSGLEQVQWTWWTTTREEEKQLLYVTPSLPEWCNVS